MAGKDRMDRMRGFFEGVGAGDTAGVWERRPEPARRISARQNQKKLEKAGRRRKAQEMI